MSEEKLLITVDMREQRSGVPAHIERSGKVIVQYADLPVGDYVLSESVVVERKESVDFVNSILDRRLFGQVAHMKATYLRPVIILEGDPFLTRSAINPEALRGALSWLTVIEGINLVYSKNAADTANYLEVMARHAQEGLGYEISLRASKPKNLVVLSQFAVEGLPSVGPVMAKKLLEHFGSVEKVFASTVDQLCEVKGVGRKTADQIRELVAFQYR